jgi:hypothetical protein
LRPVQAKNEPLFKKQAQKKRAGNVAQAVVQPAWQARSADFKPQYNQKKKKKILLKKIKH